MSSSSSSSSSSASANVAATESRTKKRSLPTGDVAKGRQSGTGREEREKVTPELRQQCVAEAAYLRAECRGFAPGCELDDWLAAELEVDALLAVEC